MNNIFLKAASVLGAVAVMLGAFGAHALKQYLNEKYLQVFETAVRYQFYHVFALLAVGILYSNYESNYLLWSGRLFCIGILLFSGSLYLLSFMEAMGQPNFKWLGAITPLGGLCLISGWVLMALAFMMKR